MKKFLSLFLIGAFFQMFLLISPTLAAPTSKDVEQTAKVKSEIIHFGHGNDAKVNVKLKNKTKLSGYISEIKDDSFVVTDGKTGSATTVKYQEVDQIHGKSLSTGAQIAIGGGIAAGVLIALFFALYPST